MRKQRADKVDTPSCGSGMKGRSMVTKVRVGQGEFTWPSSH